MTDMNNWKEVIEVTDEDREAFRTYLEERENAEATVAKYMTDTGTFLRYLGDDRRIGKGRIVAYKEWLMERYAVNSVNSMLAALNQFLEYMGAPGLKVRQVKTQRNLFLKEGKELSGAEFRALVQTARKEGRRWLAVCMETIAATGIRISELKAFTVEAVKNGRVGVYNKGKYRWIPLSGAIRKKLLTYSRTAGIRSGQIFINGKGKALDRSRIWREMKCLAEKAGVAAEKIFPHNLRHLFARVYYRSTKDLFGLADLLGHSNVNVTRIYARNTEKMYQKQLDRMRILRI